MLAPAAALRDARRLGRYVVATVLVGLLAGGFALLFRLGLHAAYRGLFGDRDVLTGVASLPAWEVVGLPAIGGALAALIMRFTLRRGNEGVGGVMEAVALARGRISFRSALTRVAACFAAVAGGAPLGREGPLIQLGAGTGDSLGRRFGLGEDDVRVLVAAGTAAGFAAAYGTPLAGILFVVEVVVGSASLRIIMPAALATVAATALAHVVAGAAPLYGARAFAIEAPAELGLFVVVGIAAGVVGVGFMALLSAGRAAFARLRIPATARAALGGALAGAIALRLPGVAGNGYEATHQVLDVGLGVGLLVALALGKAAATTCAVSAGSPGGVFTPALFLGAVVGRLLAVGFIALGATIAPGAYAVVGMAALCAATTHAPLMAAVLVFELTGDYALALPLLAATATATAVARRLREDSLYTEELRQRGVAWAEAPARVAAPPSAP